MTEVPNERREINPDLLWDIGYRSLTRSQVTDLLNDLFNTLELRVGTRLAEGLDHNQLAHFERAVDSGDEAQSLLWLQKNVPNYKTIVEEEYNFVVKTLEKAGALRQKGSESDPERAPLRKSESDE